MAQELGKIEKPDAENFKKGRKIYLVPLLYSMEENPEFDTLLDLYWKQVAGHINNLESKIGLVTRVYHESVSETGGEAMKIIEKISPRSFQIVKEKCQHEATLEAVEDKDLLSESIDWHRCLLIGFMSEVVARKVTDFHIECSRRRYEYIAKKIDETLKGDEAGILFINERHMVQFPADIEVFRISPPALNDVYRWLRDKSEASDKYNSDKEKG